jgi:type I restriction enzyme M protein
MNQTTHNRLISFIWSIADDCLRDVYVRGKYRDVILPMVVLRRLDALLEPTKDAVTEEVRFQREEAGFTELEAADLQRESGHVFYNTSPWTLQRIYNTATNSRQQLLANYEEYLDGFRVTADVRRSHYIAKASASTPTAHRATYTVLWKICSLEAFVTKP